MLSSGVGSVPVEHGVSTGCVGPLWKPYSSMVGLRWVESWMKIRIELTSVGLGLLGS